MTEGEKRVQDALSMTCLDPAAVERVKSWLEGRLDRIRTGLRRAGLAEPEVESMAARILGAPDTLADDVGRRCADRWWMWETLFWVLAFLTALAGAAYFVLRWVSVVPTLLCIACATSVLYSLLRRKPALEQGQLVSGNGPGRLPKIDLQSIEAVRFKGRGKRLALLLRAHGKEIRLRYGGDDWPGLAAEILGSVPASAQIECVSPNLLSPRAEKRSGYVFAAAVALGNLVLLLAGLAGLWTGAGISRTLLATLPVTVFLVGLPGWLSFRQRTLRITRRLASLALVAELVTVALLVDSREREAMIVAFAFVPFLLLSTALLWAGFGLSRRSAIVVILLMAPPVVGCGWVAGLVGLPRAQRVLASPGFSVEAMSSTPDNARVFLASAAEPETKQSRTQFILTSRDTRTGEGSTVSLGHGVGAAALSHDGSRIAATVLEQERALLYVLDDKLESLRPASSTDGIFFWSWRGMLNPWSPRGGRLAFVEDLKGKVRTRCLNVESGEVFDLPVLGFNSPLVWLSEDKLCFLRFVPGAEGQAGRFVAAELRYDGSEYREVLRLGELKAWALFPEEGAVLLLRDDASGLLVPLGRWEDVRTVGSFTEFPLRPWEAAISSDLELLAFTYVAAETVRLRLTNLKHGVHEDVFSVPYGALADPAFSRGSHQLAFAWHRARWRTWEDALIYTFDAEGRRLRRVGSQNLVPPVVAPVPVKQLRWSPDGTRLLWGASYVHVGLGGLSTRVALWSSEALVGHIP